MGVPVLDALQGLGFWFESCTRRKTPPGFTSILQFDENLENQIKSPALQNAKDGPPQVQVQSPGHPSDALQGRVFWFESCRRRKTPPGFPSILKFDENLENQIKTPALQNAKDGPPQAQVQSPGHPSQSSTTKPGPPAVPSSSTKPGPPVQKLNPNPRERLV